jgi:glycosyltransferase involved in cell wall biosynthesis
MRHEASDVAVGRSRVKGALRDMILQRLYSRIDGFAVIGTEARRHLLRLGVPEQKMGLAPYCVDTDFFAGEVARWGPQRETLRRELGIGASDVALVFSGKLILKKDPLLIPAAIKLLPADRQERVHLLVAGDGELRAEMERVCRTVLGDRLHMLGFLNQTQIGSVYSAGDLLVLPSKRGAGETWGLVVNEAMQFGLVPLVSDGVGCAPDLIAPGNGVVFRSADAGSLSEAIARFVAVIPRQWLEYRREAQAVVERFSAEVVAGGIKALAQRSKHGFSRT